MSIHFAHPRHDYASYGDYKRLISLTGYPQCYADEIDKDSDNCYIISSPDLSLYKGFENARCKVIGWDIEHYNDFDPTQYPNVEFWTCDAAYAKRKGIRFVFMGSDESLAGYDLTNENSANIAPHTSHVFGYDGLWHETFPMRYVQSHNRPYDVILLAHMTGRRQAIWGDLHRAGLRLAPQNEGLSGQARDTMLRQTRAMVYIHQRDEYQAIAPQRFALAAAYGLPIITETLPDCAPFGYSHLLSSSYQYLGEFAAMWLNRNDSRILEDYGRALHSFLCKEHTFKMQVEGNA